MVKTFHLDCAMLREKAAAHEYLARTLQLPDYYGRNLDALYDCLTALGPCTLVLTGAEALRQEGGYGEKVLATIEDAARDNSALHLQYASAPMTVRFATEADAESLLAIYAPYIDTAVTFEYTCPTAEEFAGRIRDISAMYPYLVLEEDGHPVGYAYAHRARERTAYDWIVELSVYLDRAYTGRGLGKKLYGLLLDLLRLQGLKTAMGCVAAPNPASEALHAALGFQLVGTSQNAGYKAGKWHDVLWYEKALAPYDVPPAPVIPIGELGPDAVAELLARYF